MKKKLFSSSKPANPVSKIRTKPQLKVQKTLKNPKSIKKIVVGFLGLLAVALTPLVTLAGTNNDPYNSSYFKEVTNNDITSNTPYKSFKENDIAYGKLLRGTKDYNGGNYVLYLGTEACPHCTNFLYGNSGYANTGAPPLGTQAWNASWSSGEWGRGITFAATSMTTSLKFLMYEDTPISSNLLVNDNLWTFPWSKYTATDLTKGEVVGEYIRHDLSAIRFREIFAFAQSLYDKVKGTPTIIAYKLGLPNIFSFSQNEVEPTPPAAATPPATTTPPTATPPVAAPPAATPPAAAPPAAAAMQQSMFGTAFRFSDTTTPNLKSIKYADEGTAGAAAGSMTTFSSFLYDLYENS